MEDRSSLTIELTAAQQSRLKQLANRRRQAPHTLLQEALDHLLEQDKPDGTLNAAARRDGSETPARGSEPRPAQSGAPQPFAGFIAAAAAEPSELRRAVSEHTRSPEAEIVQSLLTQTSVVKAEETRALAERLIESLKRNTPRLSVNHLIQEYSLDTEEGVALMRLAEALLRIPDQATRDALLEDKLAGHDWRSHAGRASSLFANAATWGLMLSSGMLNAKGRHRHLNRAIHKAGLPLLRKGTQTAMQLMSRQFVCGQNIEEALQNSRSYEQQGYTFSYDMLGEAAVSTEDAARYYQEYKAAITAIGHNCDTSNLYGAPGVSIKLSALHPRYERNQRPRVMNELASRLLSLCRLARRFNVGINIDAEESHRLDMSLDLLEMLCEDEQLQCWHGIGFVVQAYQKRASFVIEHLINLARRSGHRLMIRLVKGAYWDAEIKQAQLAGLKDYPVFTRKLHTDISYLACARKLLDAAQWVFPQFATHNAQTIAAVYHMAGPSTQPHHYEFQCLFGMGKSLYDEVVGTDKLDRRCRIYAPVGSHQTLLPYLVRRLLENGANTSFVNLVADPDVDVSDLVRHPLEQAAQDAETGEPHREIPLPPALYQQQGQARQNSLGLDLADELVLRELAQSLAASRDRVWRAIPSGQSWQDTQAQSVRNPADHRDIVGYVQPAQAAQARAAAQTAAEALPRWRQSSASDRAGWLRGAADRMEQQLPVLLGLIIREAGKSFDNAVAEVREAVDFLRYYAWQLEQHPEQAQEPLGVVLCISPWNFPLAIFTGQVAAALAAGNTVVAKPAEQTPLIAAEAVRILHEAGIPDAALQLMPGDGDSVGAVLSEAPQVRAVMFTGSTEVARGINRVLAKRTDEDGRRPLLIAETGGQNALIVDSSALPEQTVIDILDSAFDSAGQRCSALRLLCIQEDLAPTLLPMLRLAMQQLHVGKPDALETDVGPVIDAEAKDTIEAHIDRMRARHFMVTQINAESPCTAHGTFVAPTLIEIDRVASLGREVFGPVLHVLTYPRTGLNKLIQEINAAGYGLTFGIHSRIDRVVQESCDQIQAGNLYVNRNIVGATVGVQPFGGQGLSGTGPKAGGPLYLSRLSRTAADSLPVELKDARRAEGMTLPGPTGESNRYRLVPRGRILAVAENAALLSLQLEQIHAHGCTAAILDTAPKPLELPPSEQARVQIIEEQHLLEADLDGAVLQGAPEFLAPVHQALSEREGPIIVTETLTAQALAAGRRYPLCVFYNERNVSNNTAAAGGNTGLVTLDS